MFAELGAGLKVAMETENVEIIKAMVAAGLGITLIPYAAIARDVRARRFAFARLRGRPPYRETGWVHLRGDSQPRTVTEMLKTFESIKDSFGGRLPAS